MKLLLNVWLGKDKLFNSRKYIIPSIQEFNSRIEYLSSCLRYNILKMSQINILSFLLESNRISVLSFIHWTYGIKRFDK